MDNNQKRVVMHSCCPGKIDIHAPQFELHHTMDLIKGPLEEWRCRGCATVIFIGDYHAKSLE